MSRNRRYNKKLTKITNINEDCSEGSSEEEQYELGESEDSSEYPESTETGEMEGSSDSEEENFVNMRPDGTRWVKLQAGKSAGRPPVHMIFKDIPGPTGYAKRNIMSGCVTNAFELIIDSHIMKHIKECTEAEARRVLKND
ncbi:hypothetical protein KPH14_006422 [Odynerus spinipes]|uniref:Uncharacterized protein n=1 Tax=Odynerus spinipes TaxID=1348599 RepID=A0AAD9RRC4_9HYME|nr:hypothetical protein KPH14_006422 [Odynerus spinipes]